MTIIQKYDTRFFRVNVGRVRFYWSEIVL